MRLRTRPAFLAAPAVIAMALTAGLSACGSTPAPQVASSPAAHPGGTSAGGSAAGTAVTPDTSGSAGNTPAAARVPPAARRVRCPAHVLGQPGEPVPPGFRPVAVVECITITSITHGHFHLDQRRQVAVSGLGRLLAALREPSAPKPKGPIPACLVPVNSGRWFVLVSATGQVIHPHVPVGMCKAPIEPVLASLNSLHWITLDTVRLRGGTAGLLRP